MGDLRFDGRVALVTGAGRGLGRAHAMYLAARGARVVVNDADTTLHGEPSGGTVAENVVAEIRAVGGEAVADTSRVDMPAEAAAMVERAVEALGRVDIVVNNAGNFFDLPFEDTPPDVVDRLLAVHVAGAFNVTRPAWRHMAARGYGRIVLTSSGAGLFGTFAQSAYGAAKMALVGLANTLALEGRDKGILTNVVVPVAATRMTEPQFGDRVAALDPALASPVVAWLCHEDCLLNGQILSAVAGRVVRVFVGVTPGYTATDLRPEDVRDHLDEILDETGFGIPQGGPDALRYRLPETLSL